MNNTILIALKCNVDDIVYAILPDDNYVTKCKVNKIEIKPCLYGNICYFLEPVTQKYNIYTFFDNDFGKTVFFTEKDAEARLRETENNHGKK